MSPERPDSLKNQGFRWIARKKGISGNH